jgi:hypothetical protein
MGSPGGRRRKVVADPTKAKLQMSAADSEVF